MMLRYRNGSILMRVNKRITNDGKAFLSSVTTPLFRHGAPTRLCFVATQRYQNKGIAPQRSRDTSACSSISSSSINENLNDNSNNNIVSRSASTLARRLEGLDQPTVWQEFSPLAVQHGAVNLGQGFPDWEPPKFVLENMKSAISTNRKANQYARSYAHMPLAQTLAEIYNQRWASASTTAATLLPIDPATQVATATGCTNVLYCALQGLVNPGDEVILLEPAFDIYSSQVKMAGGIPVYVPLRPIQTTTNGGKSLSAADADASNLFTLDLEELRQAITPRTRVLLLNTPHNPTGKMFSLTELQGIADIAKEHATTLTVISDEVYEHIVFEPETQPHISIATILPEQTLTLSSAGKTFSATGWKVGWAIGPPHLVAAVTAVQQWVNFSAATPNQDAIALSLQAAEEPYMDPNNNKNVFPSYYSFLASEYKRKRTLLALALITAGMTPIIPPGGFFIMADTSNIDFPYEERYQQCVTDAMPARPMPRDWALSRWLTEDVGVTAIPPSAFYSTPNVPLAKNMLRFAFCKDDDTILEAQRRFDAYFGAKRL